MEIIPFLYVQAKKPNQEGSDDHYQVLTEHMYSSKYTTVADSDFQIRAGGPSSRPCDRGGGLNKFFLALRASVWSRSKVLFSQQKKRGQC